MSSPREHLQRSYLRSRYMSRSYLSRSYFKRSHLKLTCAVLLTGLIWLVVLPRLSRWEPIRERIRANEAAGIDPSALFYSDLEHLVYRDGRMRDRHPRPPSVRDQESRHHEKAPHGREATGAPTGTD